MDFQENKAFAKAIKLLSKNDYSKPRLKQKLQAAGMDNDQIKSAIENLEDQNLLREEAYINQFIRKHMRRGLSSSYIQKKLMQEKVNVDEEKIKEIFREENLTHEEQIKTLITKKLAPHFRPPADSIERQKLLKKLLSYLHSKGHNIDDGLSYLETILKI